MRRTARAPIEGGGIAAALLISLSIAAARTRALRQGEFAERPALVIPRQTFWLSRDA